MDFVDLAQRFVTAHFPGASSAIVGGSTSSGTRTPTSDIDLLVLGEAMFDDCRSSLAATYQY
ncbi:MAG: nucleotidyltransferase domain-containing protein, partial [Microbacterium sp.]